MKLAKQERKKLGRGAGEEPTTPDVLLTTAMLLQNGFLALQSVLAEPTLPAESRTLVSRVAELLEVRLLRQEVRTAQELLMVRAAPRKKRRRK